MSYQIIYMPSRLGKYFWVNFDLVKHAERPYDILNSSFIPFKSNFTELKKLRIQETNKCAVKSWCKDEKHWIFFTF